MNITDEGIRRKNALLASHYDEGFYKKTVDDSLRSARKSAAHLVTLHRPRSVIDFGCGRGTWLKAFSEHGAQRLVGLDGCWNSQDAMIDSSIEFIQCDLERIPPMTERFDLAISLEVGEHLSGDASQQLVSALCNASDMVLFSAAIPGQGGENHINEQFQSYWATMFVKCGYYPLDFFRPKLWLDKDVALYYQQNMFLYINGRASLTSKQCVQYCAISSLEFMNIRHPEKMGIKVHFAGLVSALRRRLSSCVG
jgi:SAM-dependent methyltransferase